MKKKQLFAGALAAAMMTASLAGCGGAASSAATSTTGGDTAGSTASADTNSGVVEVTIPSFKTGENVGAVFFEPQVERFNEKYAGKYKINLESVPQDSIFNDRIKQLAQQNKLPVLVEGGDPDWVKNVVIPNGLAYDLTDWIDATPAIKDVLIDDSREYCSNEDGRVMVMPLATVRPIGFFYNSAMWSTDADISAMSMDEFVSALGDQKIAFSTAENGWVSALFLTALVAEEDGGVEWLKSGIETKITDFNQPCFINAVAKLQNLLQNNAASNSVGAAYADAANAFMSERPPSLPTVLGCPLTSRAPTPTSGPTALTARRSVPPCSRATSALPTPPLSVSGGSLLLPLRMKLLLQRLSLSSFTAPLSWKPTCWPRVATHRS